jgi:AcrR family transcriptional regulator
MSEIPQGRARNARGEGARLRSEILAEATRMIGQLGDADALSIRALCDAVGVTAPSIYRHFTDKAALLRAVVRAGFEEFSARLDAVELGSVDPFDALRRRALAYLRFAETDPGTYRVLFSAASLGPEPLGLPQGPHPGEAALSALVQTVGRCLDARGDRDRDAGMVAVSLWSLLHGMADLRIGKPELPWNDPVDALDDALRRYELDGPRRRRASRPAT